MVGGNLAYLVPLQAITKSAAEMEKAWRMTRPKWKAVFKKFGRIRVEVSFI
jgi:hypothetical protein